MNNSLINNFGFNEIQKYVDENRDKIWEEWLEYFSTFPKPGKQGLVGLLKTKTNEKIVFKLSQYINYLVFHEYTIMKSLNDISPYCPHFCKTYGIVNCKVDPYKRKEGNPFEYKKSKYPIVKEVLLCEYLEDCPKFYNYIKNKKVPDNVIYSTIKQVLMAIIIAQQEKKLTHYDLHSQNIMMKKCNKDMVFLYVLDEENQFAIATYGAYPIVIDFGFSYISEMEDDYLWPSMGHTEVGFMSDRFDTFSDAKLFLNSVATDLEYKRYKKKQTKTFNNIVDNLFSKLKIEKESGWDNNNDSSALDKVAEILEPINKYSVLFDKYEHYCIEIIQTLIICPLSKQENYDVKKVYKTFLKEWVKIENEISDPFYNIYILKGIICSARIVRHLYINIKHRNIALKNFSELVYSRINEVSKFCMPKELNTELLLCSLLMLSKCIENILYKEINKRMKKKIKEYNKLPISSLQEIYAIFETNIKEDYIYNENTQIYIFDCIKKNTESFKLKKKHINLLNKIHPLCKGTTLYDIYNNKSPI